MRGIYTALITPFNSENELDLPAFEKMLGNQIQAGIAGVSPCGTTGEASALTLSEKITLIRRTLDVVRGTGVRVLAATGSNQTAETLELSTWASAQGVDGILVVTPYYIKPSSSALETYFTTVAQAIDCELVLYNVPGRTAVSLTADTIAKLAAHPRIRSIKEASGQLAFGSEILDSLTVRGHSLDLLSGDDATYLALGSIGAVGAVSVASNLIPQAMVALYQAVESGSLEAAQKIHHRYYPIFRDLFVDSNPVPIKFAMERAGGCHSRVRSPLGPLSSAHALQLTASLRRCDLPC